MFKQMMAVVMSVCLFSGSAMALKLSAGEAHIEVSPKVQVSGLEKVKNAPKIQYRTETNLSAERVDTSGITVETYLVRYQSASLSFLELRLKQVEQSLQNLSLIQVDNSTIRQNLSAEKTALEQLIAQAKKEATKTADTSDQTEPEK